jgi:MFS family permease
MFSFAPISRRIGRRPAFLIFFILAFCSVQAAFFGIRDVRSACLLALPLGICALAPFAAYAIYFPELYPTRLRSTGIGFCYNCARIVAAGAPFLLGTLAHKYAVANDATAGLRTAASIVACVYVLGLIGLVFAPETNGQPLPE